MFVHRICPISTNVHNNTLKTTSTCIKSNVSIPRHEKHLTAVNHSNEYTSEPKTKYTEMNYLSISADSSGLVSRKKSRWNEDSESIDRLYLDGSISSDEEIKGTIYMRLDNGLETYCDFKNISLLITISIPTHVYFVISDY